MNRRLLIIIAIPVVLACVCTGGALVVYAAGGGDRAKTSSTQTATANDFLNPLKALCTGQSAGVSGAAQYIAGSGVHPMVAFRSTGTTSSVYNRDTRIGTGDWEAKSLAETQLVACEEDVTETIEDCEYTTQSTGAKRTVYRMQYQVKIRLISAKDGDVVATETLRGTEPRECMDTESFSSGATSMTLTGSAVAVSDIQAWLRPNVAP